MPWRPIGERTRACAALQRLERYARMSSVTEAERVRVIRAYGYGSLDASSRGGRGASRTQCWRRKGEICVTPATGSC
jgi:hypothetical protein